MLPAMLTAIDHTGIAVQDIEAAVSYYRDVLRLPLVHREVVTEHGVQAALFDIGQSHIELLSPLGPETAVARFLEKRGPGLHHVAYRVQDIDAALAELTAAGVRLIDATPRTGIRGSRVAFLQPAFTGGVLTEIVEPATEGNDIITNAER
jgi:methylmalonyl-CoA/ethylmalonyl-CoA epimerase